MKQVDRSRLIAVEAMNYSVALVQDLETRTIHIVNGEMSDSVRKYMLRKINKFNVMIENKQWYQP